MKGSIIPPVEDYNDNRKTEDESLTLYAISGNVANDFFSSTRQLGQYLLQMGAMMSTMQRRMDEMEARQAAVTIRHADVIRIRGMIRSRADEICRKYGLEDPGSRKAFVTAIRKDVLRRYQVKDLHDLPAAGMAGAENLIGGWTNIRMVMERRGSA